MTDPGHGVHPDGEGNYIIVGTPVPASHAQSLGADPIPPGAAAILINRQTVDHYRNPKARRLWQQAMWDRADLRHRLRLAEAEITRLKGHTRTVTENLTWRRSTATPVIHSGGTVEVAELEDGTILVRNSDHPATVLEFSDEEWVAFLEGVDNGEFDPPEDEEDNNND